MLFSSFEFIFIFLPISFFIYFYLNRKKLGEASKAFLLVTSLFFYSWWNIVYLPLILISMIFNYVIGVNLSKNIENRKISKKTLLIFGIISNVSLLGYFKYSDFFIDNFNGVFGSEIPLLNLALPLAISFFTFQQIAYLVDSFRNETKEYDFLNYAVFVSFFPQLIAGPIVHHKEMMPQFESARTKIINYKNIAAGLFIFSIGLFKKIVVADTFSVWATNGFDKSETLSFIEAWVTSYSYTFQLYYDFSGYTDMAIGAALLFNIKLPINFNSPYKARNIQDFWRRWHITLSRFLRDYIYIPLGGNKKGKIRTYYNLLATFVIGGFWHGAGWTFIIWGAMQGIAIAIHRIWSEFNIKIPYFIAWFITINFVNISWVFFRALTFDDAIKVLKGMFGLNTFLPNGMTISEFNLTPEVVKSFQFIQNQSEFDLKVSLIIALITLLTTFWIKNSIELLKDFKPTKLRLVIFIFSILISLIFMNSVKEMEFLYFDF